MMKHQTKLDILYIVIALLLYYNKINYMVIQDINLCKMNGGKYESFNTPGNN